MPVFVEWKWVERTKSLLIIFHFYDDFSKPNLRVMESNDDMHAWLYSPKWDSPEARKGGLPHLENSWISWASSHLEMALLMQLLCYANIINGLKPFERKKIWFKLEGKDVWEYVPDYYKPRFAAPDTVSKRIGKDTKVILYKNLRDDSNGHAIHTCVELCPEYIDYIRGILRPHLSD